MRAIVVEQPGPPDVLKIKDVPIPLALDGWALVRIRAFGINRSEMFTRQGHSPGVKFPRVLGIEAVGKVEADPSGKFQPGQTVAAVMGGMGRDYDGGYAEYAVIPVNNLLPLETNLDWVTLGAIPEMFLTVWSSLTESLEVESGQTLLVRGGTSSIGMMTITLAKSMGLTVIATTRSDAKKAALLEQGADYVVIDDGQIAAKVRDIFRGGVNRVQELVGTKTLLDSLQCAAPQGIVCFTGILGNEWSLTNFEPFLAIPSSVKLTTYTSENLDREKSGPALQNYVQGVERGAYQVRIDRVFKFDDIVEAHKYMESNRATGKLVVVVN